jgi:dCTP deaminase
VAVRRDGRLDWVPIGDVVDQRLEAEVVSFDPDTFEVGFHAITGWYRGPADRIFEVRLASGRTVRVTAGHNFFTVDPDGHLTKLRTNQLRPGARVALPRQVPDPGSSAAGVKLLDAIPESDWSDLTCSGPSVRSAFINQGDLVAHLLRQAGIGHVSYYRARGRLPLKIAAGVPRLVDSLGVDDRIHVRGSSTDGLPCSFEFTAELAWLLGLYIAEGCKRRNQVVVSNTDQAILDRAEGAFRSIGLTCYRGTGSLTACSTVLSTLLTALGTGESAHSKRVPPTVFSWPWALIKAFMEGLVDGGGSWSGEWVSVWTSSDGLATDVLFLAERLGLRAGSSVRERPGSGRLWQVYVPLNEHKLLTSVPLPDRLLVKVRKGTGLDQRTASTLAGYRHPTDLANIESRSGRDAVRLSTLRRLRATYARRATCDGPIERLHRLIDGDLLWDRVAEVRDTGESEPIYDIEVRPGGRKVENFLAGDGGVFVSNTAGFVDAGWDGHLTLELSNVANLPIAIYPGMKIGQISFLKMTGEAEAPYGSDKAGSKYKGQTGPTPSRYYLNFPPGERG